MKPRGLAGHRRERGAIAALAGIFMLMLAGITVVGVDVGRLAFTASEVQTVADAGAIAYAKEMLTQNTSGTTNIGLRQARAYEVIAGNNIDGAAAAPVNITSFEEGAWDFGSNQFSAGGSPPNAVRANATATVSNFFAGLFGDPTTTVDKNAIAALGCSCRDRPVLPLAVGDCNFDAFQNSGDCADLPHLQQQPNAADNSCWTNLSPSSGGGSAFVKSILPTQCCQGGDCGGGEPGPSVSKGDQIWLQNGQANDLMHILQDCVQHEGITDFVVPIVDCDTTSDCTHTGEVVGFASVRISNVVDQGQTKTVDLEFFCDDSGGQPDDCECFGRQGVAMVK